MILDDFVKEQMEKNPDGLLFIGAASAFFFIGTPAEWFEQADDVSKMYRAKLERTLATNELKYSEAKKTFEAVLKNTSDIDVIITEAEPAVRAKNNRDRAKMVLYACPPFGKREVTESYSKKAERGLAVIVEGRETGLYWTKDEWDHAAKRRSA